jgi:membrane protein
MTSLSDRIGAARGAISSRWSRLRARRPAVRHAAGAWQRLSRTNGNLYAGAITFFSFLALFPLLLLAVSVLGFVLHANPHTQQQLLDKVTTAFPGSAGSTLRGSIKAAIDARASVGVIGLIGVLSTGLGWVGNLRAAIDAVWDRGPVSRNPFTSRLVNLMILGGLGIGSLLSVGLTVVGSAVTEQLLSLFHVQDAAGAAVLLKVSGYVLAVAGDMVIFTWVLIRLPDPDVPRRTGLKAALMASIGFEVLKTLGSYTIAHTADSPTAGPFAGLVAVLVWIQLVARWLLYCVAWTAVVTEEGQPDGTPQAPVPTEERAPARASASPLSPAAVGVGLVGAGAVAGVAVATVAGRAWRRQGERSHSSR